MYPKGIGEANCSSQLLPSKKCRARKSCRWSRKKPRLAGKSPPRVFKSRRKLATDQKKSQSAGKVDDNLEKGAAAPCRWSRCKSAKCRRRLKKVENLLFSMLSIDILHSTFLDFDILYCRFYFSMIFYSSFYPVDIFTFHTVKNCRVLRTCLDCNCGFGFKDIWKVSAGDAN